jgi:hypothetical protein
MWAFWEKNLVVLQKIKDRVIVCLGDSTIRYIPKDTKTHFHTKTQVHEFS